MFNHLRCSLFGKGLVGVALLCAQSHGIAADLTMTSGFYQKSNSKIEGKSKGSTSLISLGGRFADDLTSEVSWIAQGDIKMRSYAASEGVPSPDNSVGIGIGGGARYYFKPFAEAVVPYVSGIATLKSDKEASWTSNGYVQKSTSGLYYSGNAGIRAGLGGNFFVELEIPFFESPLFAVTKTETLRQEGTTTTTSKEENTETSLYVSSVAKITDVKLGLGMRF